MLALIYCKVNSKVSHSCKALNDRNRSRETNLGRYGLWSLLSYIIRTIYFIILEALILNKDKLSCGRNTFTWIGAFRRHTSSRFKSLNITLLTRISFSTLRSHETKSISMYICTCTNPLYYDFTHVDIV